jgi:hypothetical protein
MRGVSALSVFTNPEVLHTPSLEISWWLLVCSQHRLAQWALHLAYSSPSPLSYGPCSRDDHSMTMANINNFSSSPQ